MKEQDEEEEEKGAKSPRSEEQLKEVVSEVKEVQEEEESVEKKLVTNGEGEEPRKAEPTDESEEVRQEVRSPRCRSSPW